jgi:hypothetical protein
MDGKSDAVVDNKQSSMMFVDLDGCVDVCEPAMDKMFVKDRDECRSVVDAA